MKNAFAFMTVLLLLCACHKTEMNEMTSDIWNGYHKFLKQGEVEHILWAGRNINVGKVTYGIDENANFYVTYDCSQSGWLLSESHVYAGEKKDMPLNKPGDPKIGRFPYSCDHAPWVSSYTYTIPLSTLPPADNPGFVVSSHCVVHSPSGQEETAWAEGDHCFTDKNWGWYDVYYFNQQQNPFTILYGILCSPDTLSVYFINVEEDTSAPVFREYVGNNPGVYDGAAYDDISQIFMFTNRTTGALWMNLLSDEGPSFCAGYLTGTPAGGAFYDGAYFYVDAVANTINQVQFTSDWQISSISVLNTIPYAISVNDISMGPTGTELYIMGDLPGGGSELIRWDIPAGSFQSLSISMTEGAQIAFGTDGYLYAISPDDNGMGSELHMVSTITGTFTPISNGVTINDEPFSDLSRGMTM